STFEIPNLSYQIPSTTKEDVSLLTSTVTATGTPIGEPAEVDPVTAQVDHSLPFQRTPGISVVRSIVGRARLGGTVLHRFSVANTGHLTLTVTLSDSVLGLVGAPFDLAPGESQQIEQGASLGALEKDAQTGTVTATGVTTDNQVVTDEHTSSFTPAALGLELTKTSIPATAAPDTTVNYLFDIENTGEVALDIGDVVDDKLGVVGNPGRLEPGQKFPMGSFFPVPKEQLVGSTIDNVVTATGTSDEGVQVTATANHSLQIVALNDDGPSDADVVLGVAPATFEASEPTTLAFASVETPDDLTEISGIGPARAKQLTEAGITTFSDLAEASVESLRELFPSVKDETLSQWKADAAERQ
ncbi:MAG: helix-hairpin-helix domain-containing protein, partial [Acidobacteriota bacterium]